MLTIRIHRATGTFAYLHSAIYYMYMYMCVLLKMTSLINYEYTVDNVWFPQYIINIHVHVYIYSIKHCADPTPHDSSSCYGSPVSLWACTLQLPWIQATQGHLLAPVCGTGALGGLSRWAGRHPLGPTQRMPPPVGVVCCTGTHAAPTGKKKDDLVTCMG